MNAPQLTAAERLTLSRERLRTAMAKVSAKPAPGLCASTHVAGLLSLLKTTLPNASLLIDALTQWWTHYTSQGNGQTAAGVVNDLIRPIAKRHPIALLLGALAVGGLLVGSRPWRWVFKPQLLAAWGPAMVSGVLASGTLQAWILAALHKSPAPPPPDQPEG